LAFGRFFEEFERGAVYRHWPGKTVTEYDHQLFCLLTMVRHPIHLDAHHSKTATRHQERLVIGSYIFSLLIGLSEDDITGKALSHLGFGKVEHCAPVLHGDTLYAESEVVECHDHQSAQDRGMVTVETRGRNQHGALVMAFQRELVVARHTYSGHKIGPLTDTATGN
jgi:acyl dehydratase